MPKRRIALLIVLIVLIALAVPLVGLLCRNENVEADDEETVVVSLWQIDGFEGGKGSRKQFLEACAKRCFKDRKIYFTVTSLTADAARANLKEGNTPDLISYPAGFYGLESKIVNYGSTFTTWCRGGYCVICTDENADFTDVNSQNTVINAGKDNLSSVAALLSGLNGAKCEEPVNAYLKLLDGSYKYLFGTQRDIYRMKTRGQAYKVKAVTAFNDLYQNISVLTNDGEKVKICSEFISNLTAAENTGKIGLLGGNPEALSEELKPFDGVEYDYKLNCPCSEKFIYELKAAAAQTDLNKLKSLLK